MEKRAAKTTDKGRLADNTTTRHQTPPAPAPKPPQTDAPRNQHAHHPDYSPPPRPLPHPPRTDQHETWVGAGGRGRARAIGLGLGFGFGFGLGLGVALALTLIGAVHETSSTLTDEARGDGDRGRLRRSRALVTAQSRGRQPVVGTCFPTAQARDENCAGPRREK